MINLGWVFGIFALINLLISLIVKSWLFKAIRSEKNLVITFISIWVWHKSCLIMSFKYGWFICINKASIRLAWSVKSIALSFRRRFRIFTHYWTIYQTFCDFSSISFLWRTYFKATSISSKSVTVNNWLLLTIKVLSCASVVWHIQILNTWRPLTLSIS